MLSVIEPFMDNGSCVKLNEISALPLRNTVVKMYYPDAYMTDMMKFFLHTIQSKNKFL